MAGRERLGGDLAYAVQSPGGNGAEAVEPDAELERAELAANGHDELAGFLDAGKSRKARVVRIDIDRPDPEDAATWKHYFSFRVTAVDEDDVRVAADNASDFELVTPGLGRQARREVLRKDDWLENCWTIALATLPEDRKRFWDNPALQRQRGVTNAGDLVRVTLLPGEVALVLVKIQELAQLNRATPERAKNS